MRPSRPPELAARFERQRAAYARDPAPPLAIRLSRLDRLRALLDTHEAALVQAIDAEGAAFDPNLHEAITHLPSDTVPEGHVATQTRRGYKLGDKLLRAAQVVVSSGPAP